MVIVLTLMGIVALVLGVLMMIAALSGATAESLEAIVLLVGGWILLGMGTMIDILKMNLKILRHQQEGVSAKDNV
ncbi:MAG: hypothetical protein V2A56_13330 [bacterium]